MQHQRSSTRTSYSCLEISAVIKADATDAERSAANGALMEGGATTPRVAPRARRAGDGGVRRRRRGPAWPRPARRCRHAGAAGGPDLFGWGDTVVDEARVTSIG